MNGVSETLPFSTRSGEARKNRKKEENRKEEKRKKKGYFLPFQVILRDEIE